MLLDRRYNLHAFDTSYTRTRTLHLAYAEVRYCDPHPFGNAVIYAANPYCMVVLPCRLGTQDVEGFIPLSYLQHQPLPAGASRKDPPWTEITLDDTEITLPNGCTTEWALKMLGKQAYPITATPGQPAVFARMPAGKGEPIGIEKVIRDTLSDGFTAMGEGLATGLNAEYLIMLQRVMGAEHIFMTPTRLHGPLLLEAERERGSGEKPTPPFAILMPISHPYSEHYARRPVYVHAGRRVVVPDAVPEDLLLESLHSRIDAQRQAVRNLQDGMEAIARHPFPYQAANPQRNDARAEALTTIHTSIATAAHYLEMAYAKSSDPLIVPVIPK